MDFCWYSSNKSKCQFRTHRGQPVENVKRWYLRNMTSERLKCPMSMIKLKTKSKWKWNDTFLYVAIFINQPKIQTHNVCDVYLSNRLLSFFFAGIFSTCFYVILLIRTMNDILLNLIMSFIEVITTMNQWLVYLI